MNKNCILDAYKLGWVKYDDRNIHEWCMDNVILPPAYNPPGKFNIYKSRYMIEPFEALKDMRIRQVNIMSSPRSGKTLVAELFLLYSIVNNSGQVLWLQSGDKMSDKISALRMVPLLKLCESVKNLIPSNDKFAITKNKFKFDNMTVHIGGANINALQSIGYKIIIGDECWLWDKGLMTEAHTRTLDFQHTSKELYISQGGDEGSDWSNEFNSGIIYEWGWKCPNCGHSDILDFSGRIRSDGTYGNCIYFDPKCKKNGVWDYLAAGKTAALECYECRTRLVDNPQNRRYLNDTGIYINTNTSGDPRKKSYRWNALANIEQSYSDIVIEYLQAKDSLSREGNKLPLQQFYMKRLAKEAKQSFNVSMSKIIKDTYNSDDNWGDYTFMTIDCQNNFQEFYYVIRSWNKSGESRKLRHGKVSSFLELRNIQNEFKIKDQCVFIDSGNFATQVYAKCIEYSHIGVVGGKKVNLSWIALQGYDAISFKHSNNIDKLYSTETRGDPNLGKSASSIKTCPHFRWSNYSIKNILMHLRDGKGQSWLSNDDDEEYARQLNSEVLTRTIDKRTNKEKFIYVQRTGVPNHLLDCECMQIVAACMVNLIGNITTKVE